MTLRTAPTRMVGRGGDGSCVASSQRQRLARQSSVRHAGVSPRCSGAKQPFPQALPSLHPSRPRRLLACRSTGPNKSSSSGPALTTSATTSTTTTATTAAKRERETSSSSAGSKIISRLFALIDEKSSSSPPAPAGSGYDGDLSSYSRPPRWLKQLATEEDETRLINFLVNVAVIAGSGIAFGVKFFAIDADISRGWTVMEILSAAPRDNWSFYESSLAANPILSKACISGMVYGLGDLTAQTYEGKSVEGLDRGRIVRSALTGFIGHGPMSHYWYVFADDLCAPLGDGFVAFAIKLVLDQTVWAFIWLSAYYALLGGLNGDGPAKIFQTTKQSMLPVCLVGWRFWPFVHVITYGVIPQQHRLLWVDVCEIVWVTILSYIGNIKRKEAQEASQEAIEMGREDANPVGTMGQLACALPSAEKGGIPAEQIARSMEVERTVCIRNDDEDTCAAAEDVFSTQHHGKEEEEEGKEE